MKNQLLKELLTFDELIDNTIGQPDTCNFKQKIKTVSSNKKRFNNCGLKKIGSDEEKKKDEYKIYLKLMERDKKRLAFFN